MQFAFSRPLCAMLVLAALAATAACGGGGGGGGSPGPPPTKAPTPTPTPTPLPSGITENVVPGKPNAFPTSGAYGGQITFAVGSQPATGNTITLSTATAQPTGYPPTLLTNTPSLQGAIAIAPWLTFTLSETLTLPPGSNTIAFAFQVPSFVPSDSYYGQLVDLPNTVLFIAPVTFQGGTNRAVIKIPAEAFRAHRNSGATQQLPAGHHFYLGLYDIPGNPGPTPSPATTTEAVTAGQPNFFPVLLGYGGEVLLPSGSSPAQNTITLTTSLGMPAGYPTAIPVQNPGFGSTPVAPWLTFQFAHAITMPAGSRLKLGICGPAPPSQQYALALFDLTNPSFFGSFQVSAPTTCGYGGSPGNVRQLETAGAPAAPTVPPDQFYLGLFQS